MYEPFIAAAARKHGVDPRVLWTIAYLETRFRPELVSPARARGLMQFMPGTARRFNLTNPHDGPAAIDAAARYVKELVGEFGGRLDLVLASYNAGEGAVDCYRTGRTIRTSAGKVINPRGIKTSGVPPYAETVSYVKRGLLVFSRVTSAGVFNPELIAGTRALQSPPMAIAVSDQRIIDSELRELGGLPVTILFSGVKQIGIGQGGGQTGRNEVAIARRASANGGDSAAFETVFFDVHSGARYLVSKGEIVKPFDVVEASGASENAGEVEVVRHVLAKSFHLGAGGE
jgi:Transglycosylase SLT domain